MIEDVGIKIEDCTLCEAFLEAGFQIHKSAYLKCVTLCHRIVQTYFVRELDQNSDFITNSGEFTGQTT